jgi:hypothetical protein
VTGEGVFYDRALRRIDRIALGISAAFVIGMLLKQGWRGALGGALGAAVSFVNLRLWRRVANSIGADGRAPATASPALLGLRYLLLGGVIFVIINYFEVSILAVLAGLLVSVAAVIFEIVYELIFTSHQA